MSKPIPLNTDEVVKAGAASVVLAAVATYLIIAPVWSPNILWWSYDNARLLEFALLLVLGAAAVMPSVSTLLVNGWSSLSRTTRGLLIIFCAFGAISATSSPAPQVGVLQFGLVVLLIYMTLLMASVIRGSFERAEPVLVTAICAGVLLVVLQFWAAQAISILQRDVFQWHSPFLGFANVRFFSQFQSYTLLLLVMPLVVFKMGRNARIAVYVLAANFWSIQWMVGTRAVWLGFIVATLLIAIFSRNHRVRWFKLQLIPLVGGFAIFLVFTKLLMPSVEAEEIPRIHSVVARGWQSVDKRVLMVKSSISLIREHPLLGVGPGQFGHNYTGHLAAHPHNSVLQFLTEYGLLGGGAIVVLIATLGICALAKIRAAPFGQNGAVSVFVSAALIMGLVDSLFSGNLTMPHSQILFCVIAGWLLARRPVRDECANTALAPRDTGQTSFALSAMVLLAASVTFVLAFEYANAINGMPFWLQPNPPNLWQYGRFSAW